jgi:hypothetical protein
MEDSEQRRNNLSAVVRYLSELGCAIVVAESGRRQCAPEVFKSAGANCSFHFDATSESLFHHTRTRNRAAHTVGTELIALWDADIVIPCNQLISTVDRLRERECDYAYPFDGRCVDFADHVSAGSLSRAMRQIAFATYFPLVEEADSVTTVLAGEEKLIGRVITKTCVGGAVLFRREVFLKGGMENESFISYGPDDQEREVRYRNLGFISYRSPGLLYHLAHPRGLNSDDGHPSSESNWAEFRRISELSGASLAAEVAGWNWTKRLPSGAEVSSTAEIGIADHHKTRDWR